MRRFAIALTFALGAAVGCSGSKSAPVCSPEAPCESTCASSSCGGVSAESARVVLHPTRMRLVTGGQECSAGVIPFGAERCGSMVLLLDFDVRLGPLRSIEKAWLVLSEAPDSRGSDAFPKLSVAPIEGPWGLDTTFGRRPPTGVSSPFVPSGSPKVPLRLDVTEWTRRTRFSGLAVHASPAGRSGLSIIGESDTVQGPRLELYLK